MILEPAYTRLWFDRLLIDKQHQGKGYAKPAVQLILQEIRSHYPNTDIYLSVYAENHPAIATQKTILQSLYIAPLDLNLQANWIPKGKKS